MKQTPGPSNLIHMAGPDERGESDSRLLREAREGGEKAFRRLVERYHPMAYAVVRGVLGDRSDVEDVVQDVFVRIYKGLAGFRGDAKPSTWIYAIARNEALNAARKLSAKSEVLEDVSLAAPDESRPDERYDRKARREHLERCLEELDDEYRVALELRYMGDMSYEEIGRAMGLPLGTVKTTIHRAKIELKRVMVRKQLVESYGKRERP